MRRVLAAALVATLILSGCGQAAGTKGTSDEGSKAPGSTAPATAPAEQPKASADASAEVPLKNLENLQDLKDLKDILKRFALLSYEFVSPDDTVKVTIRHKGQEAGADRVSIEMASKTSGDVQQMEFWINAAGQTVKVVQGGQEIPGEMAGALGNAMLTGLLWPFVLAGQMDLKAALQANNAVSPYHVSKSSKQKKQIGSLSADTYILEVQARGTAGSGTYSWEIADFGSFQMWTRWEFNMTGAAGSQKAEYRVVEVALR